MTTSRLPGLLPALVLPFLAGCSDLLPDSGRIPTSLQLADTLIYATEGETLVIPVVVLDQNGDPIDPVPVWATPRWTTAGDAVQADGEQLTAVTSGSSRAAVRVGDLRATATIRVNPSSIRTSIDAVHLTQSVQRLDGSIPLVEGRDALLRVFLSGDEVNFFEPEVRVQLFQDGAPVETLTAVASAPGLPTSIDDADFTRSWNVMIPGARMRPGLSLSVQADVAGTLPLEAGSVTTFPATGGPMALDVRAVPPLSVRIVPIQQGTTTSTGSLGTHSPESFSSLIPAMYPVEEFDVSVRSTYTSAHTTADANGWSEILREIALLRIADGDERYYYGILAAGPTGTQGIGYIGYPAAIGSDNALTGPETYAHEIGHNFGRRHAPCGGVSGPDPNFPYSNGGTGHPGYNVFNGQTKNPARVADLMSYCDPTWISDYNYEAVLAYREQWDWPATATDAAEPSLLVWGGVSAGGAVLEPALELVTRPRMPASPGPYRVEGLDEAGAVLFSLPFMPDEVADAGAGERQFVFAIPTRIARTDRLASLRLTGPAARETRGVARAGRVPDQPSFSLSPDRGGATVLSWSAASHPLAAVRDVSTGEIVALSRTGSVELPGRAGEVELLLSDGIRTTARRVRLP